MTYTNEAAYRILVTESFLSDLVRLQPSVSNRVPQMVRTLERDPRSAGGDARKLKNSHSRFYRVRVAGDYRMIYAVGRSTVKLFKIGHRSSIYRNLRIPRPNIPDEDQILDPPIPPAPSEAPSPHQTAQKEIEITTDLLSTLGITDPQYVEHLCAIETEDELLQAAVPHDILVKVLDELFPKSLDDLSTQPERVVSTPEDLDRFYEGEIDITSFLLSLDSEQERLLQTESDEPILVRGGPGTGKSIMAVYKIHQLSEENISPILLATHSSSFRAYSGQLLERLTGGSIHDHNIEIKTIKSLISSFFADHYHDARSIDHDRGILFLQEVLQSWEHYRPDNIGALSWATSHARVMQLGHEYILQEIQEVIEACCLTEAEYMTLDRGGAGTSIGMRERKFLWEITQKWQDRLRTDGYFSEGMKCKEALRIAQGKSPRFQYLVVDEAQDISPVEFRFLLCLLAPEHRNDIYVTADNAQAIYRRGFSWRIIYRYLNTKTILNLNRNYRSTEQISSASSAILADVNENPANNEGERPFVVKVDGLDEEVEIIKQFFLYSARRNRLPLHGAAILCFDERLAREYAQRMNAVGLSARYASGGDINIEDPSIKVLTLFDAKGLEFPFVAIPGTQIANSNLFRDFASNELKDEREVLISQFKRLLYVGCSRAMKTLLVTRPENSVTCPENDLSGLFDVLREPLWQQSRGSSCQNFKIT